MNTQTVIDQLCIGDLQNQYAYAIDSGQYDRLDAMFLADAAYDFGPAGSANSVTEIKATIRAALEPLSVAQHVNGNQWAQVDGDQATAGCYFRVHMHRHGVVGGEHFEMGGRYDDSLVRTAKGWRFARRIITILWSDGNPDVRWAR